jgi:sugar phosphate isomerase/epimerase
LKIGPSAFAWTTRHDRTHLSPCPLLCEKGIEEFEIPMRVLMDRFHANMEEKNIGDAVQGAGSRLKHRHESQNDCGLLGSGGHVDFPAIVAAPREIGFDGYLMIRGFGYLAAERNSRGAFFWGGFERDAGRDRL